jgi:hypothetical protein
VRGLCYGWSALKNISKLDAVRVFECQHRAVFALDDGRVMHTELLEPCQPLIEAGARIDFEPHVIEPGAAGIEGFALIPVVLLELNDGPRRRMQQQDCVPPIAANLVDFGEFEQRSPPAGAHFSVTDRKRNMRHPLLKAGMKVPLSSHLAVERVLSSEYVVCLTHHLPEALARRGSASHCPTPSPAG